VQVNRVTYAPIANDDFDTTRYETAVIIPILDNDEDPDGDMDSTSLAITQFPSNGSVYINYDDYTLTYTPADGFFGNDVFEYQICDFENQCDQANVFVMVLEGQLHIPEAFTPNGDNVNDFFEIEGIQQFEGNSLTIINRWGKKVYEARNYGISTSPVYWDGKWSNNGNNNDVPTGTYYYILDLGNGEQPIAGSVYIDR
jgi:gliding motility-associated-like protein